MSVDDAVGVINDELAADSAFCDCWNAALDVYKDKLESNPLYDWEHMDAHCHWALICYLLEKPNISRRMNRFCREALPEPRSWNAFPYKGLWFFLIRAFEVLPPFPEEKVFRGVTAFSITRTKDVPLQQFLSGSLLVTEAERFALPRGFVLNLINVGGHYLRDVSFHAVHPNKKEVLIWPFIRFSSSDLDGDRHELVVLTGTPPDRQPRPDRCHSGGAQGENP